MKKILLIGFLLVFLIPIVTAEQQTLGTFKKGECITLTQTCNCTYVNFTSVYKTGSDPKFLIEENIVSTKRGTVFSYNLCNITPANGEYIVTGIGDVGKDVVFAYNYFVTSEGNFESSWIPILIVFIFIYLILALGTFTDNIWIVAISSMGMIALGVYVHINGLGDIKNFITDMFALVNWALGALIFLVVTVQEASNQLGGN